MINFYLPASGQVIPSSQLRIKTGFEPTDDPGLLASNGIYIITEAPADPYDPGLFTSTIIYTIVGIDAIASWTATPKPLPVAIANGSQEVKTQAAAEISVIESVTGLPNDILTVVSGQELIDRPVRFQTVLESLAIVTDGLNSNLLAIESATTVDEINNIVNKPTGVINIGRGQFGGPYDLNASNYVSFNSVSMTQSETELYAPITSSTVPYQGVPPDDFNSSGPIFVVGDYLIQIRETATSMVIAEFEVPLSLDGSNADIAFDNGSIIV